MQTESKTRTSFFDDDDLAVQFTFKKFDKNSRKLIEVPPTVSGNLIVQKPGQISLPQQTTFAMHAQSIVHYQYGSLKTPETILEVAHSRLKELEPDHANPNYGFSLTKNGLTYEFFAPEKKEIDIWVNNLKSICILSQFHNEYKAIKMIGRGSFAKVYLVESKVSGKQYAVKSFVKESFIASNKQSSKPSMLNEIDLMRAMNHDNVIKIYEVYETEKSIYLVIELIEGKPLQDIIQKPSFKNQRSDARIMKMIYSILDALAYMSSKGIMHRDLKPDNILVGKEDKVKIADFGLATYVDLPEYIYKKCGTPGYIAPEVLKYDQKIPKTFYDHQCDAFSAGCILFYMLFGRPFFDGKNASEILLLNRKYSYLDAKNINFARSEMNNPLSQVPKEGINLCIQLLEFDPKKRLSTSKALTHSFFSSMRSDSIESLDISEEDEFTPRKRTSFMAEHIFASRRESVGLGVGVGSPTLQPRDRFAQRDSLFLDMGRPEYTGKVDTLVAGSHNNSLLFPRKGSSNESSNNGSLSNFGKSPLTPDSKKRASVRPGVAGSQSVLKAAIFRNMQKNNEEEGREEVIREEDTPGRRRTSDVSRGSPATAKSSDSSFDSDIAGDICQEEPQVEFHILKLKGEAGVMIPSQKAHCKVQFPSKKGGDRKHEK